MELCCGAVLIMGYWSGLLIKLAGFHYWFFRPFADAASPNILVSALSSKLSNDLHVTGRRQVASDCAGKDALFLSTVRRCWVTMLLNSHPCGRFAKLEVAFIAHCQNLSAFKERSIMSFCFLTCSARCEYAARLLSAVTFDGHLLFHKVFLSCLFAC